MVYIYLSGYVVYMFKISYELLLFWKSYTRLYYINKIPKSFVTHKDSP